MPIDPEKLRAILTEIEDTPDKALRLLDRELLALVKQQLTAFKTDVDKALLRLAFLDEQVLN